MIDNISEFADLLKGSFPFTFIFVIPLIILLSPTSPVDAAHEFSVFRMQQFDLQGSSFGNFTFWPNIIIDKYSFIWKKTYLGSQSSVINVEARPVDASSVIRKCVVSKLADFTIEKYKDIVSSNAAGLLIILPKDLDSFSQEEKLVNHNYVKD